MADGITVIRPSEARDKATRMKTIADELQTLMRAATEEIEKINDVNEGIYQGAKKPAQLKAELDDFSREFYRTYGQIEKSAKDIIEIANTKENI